MGESDGIWGQLAGDDPELADAWDDYARLPDVGENDVLDAFVTRKHIDISSLIRVGARLASHKVLVFGGPGYIKFRDMETDRRWTLPGSTYNQLRAVPSQTGDSDTAIVAEGETDAARLTMLYPEAVIFILPAGARHLTQSMVDQVKGYPRVLATYDPDEAGNAGWAKLVGYVTHAVRFNPPDGSKDWCAYEGELPALPDAPAVTEQSVLVSLRDLFELDYPEVASYFDQELLPIGGQMVEHGWAKNYKSFIALDIMAALAQGTEWCGFANIEEAVDVCVVQFEIAPKYYADRMRAIHSHASEKELLLDHFHTWTPQSRPQLRVNNPKLEEYMRSELVRAGIQVVLFDPLRRLMPAGLSLNDEDSARFALSFFESLQNEGISVIFTHHDNKAGAKAGNADETSMTGSGAWAGDADTIIGVERVKGEPRHSGKRNINFLLRNAPSPAPRGMQMMEDSARILYSHEPFGVGEDPEDPDAPDI